MKRILVTILAAAIAAPSVAFADDKIWLVVAGGGKCTPLFEAIHGAFTPEEALQKMKSVGLPVALRYVDAEKAVIEEPGSNAAPLPMTTSRKICREVLPIHMVRGN